VILLDQDLKLSDLLVQYPNESQNLAIAIRQIVGLDAQKVDNHFRQFVQDHPTINSMQIRFLELIKNHVQKHGAIEINKLYEAPFTTINHEGIDGVFQEEQIDSLLELINTVNSAVA